LDRLVYIFFGSTIDPFCGNVETVPNSGQKSVGSRGAGLQRSDFDENHKSPVVVDYFTVRAHCEPNNVSGNLG